MAETNDRNAHYRSIDVRPNSLPMLNGQRYALNFLRNQQYQITEEYWQTVQTDLSNNNTSSLVDLAKW